jgi:hypothetical protein
LSILATIPKDIASPAADVVKRISTTPMHPNAFQAGALVKNWAMAE